MKSYIRYHECARVITGFFFWDAGGEPMTSGDSSCDVHDSQLVSQACLFQERIIISTHIPRLLVHEEIEGHHGLTGGMLRPASMIEQAT